LPLHIYFRSPFRWVIPEEFHEFCPQIGQIPARGAVGVASEGAEFLAAPAQGVGGVGVLPRVAVVVVVEGEQAGVCEVIGVVVAGGQLVRLPLQVV
jgi:multidrug efflux pump subunit AcrA (membrane-fusion protein)